jgi:Uma2 family endonuclease
VDPEVLPNLEDLVIEDGKPVETIFTEKQLRLLTEALYACWGGPEDGRPFLVLANVGLFYASRQPPLVPDVMLSLGVEQGDLSVKANRSYFVWLRGKPPEVVIEIISDRYGGELTHKMGGYARAGVPYYAIFDPRNILGRGPLLGFGLHLGAYAPMRLDWLADVGLGLMLWEGTYEGSSAQWLRWCDGEGTPIPTGSEGKERERQHAEQERQHAEQERQHAEQERQRAEQAHQRAEQERQRAEEEKQRNERLRAQLRALGIEPTD